MAQLRTLAAISALLIASASSANSPIGEGDRCGLGVLFGHAPSLQITSVIDGSPAQGAGVKQGDIVSAINGIFVFSVDELARHLQTFTCGDDIKLTLVNITDSPLPRTVTITLAGVDFSVVTVPEFEIPDDYPDLPPGGFLKPIDDALVQAARSAAVSVRADTNEELPRGFYLGRKNFEGEGKKKFWTSAVTGVQVGKAELRFYLITPYSEARHRFYEAAKQFEELTTADVVDSLRSMKYAYVVPLQNAAAENLAANLTGFGSLTTNTYVVVIRRGSQVFQPIGNNGAGWAFPLEVFDYGADFEIVAVSVDNLHAVLKPKLVQWKDVR